jgi:hypothetical protein
MYRSAADRHLQVTPGYQLRVSQYWMTIHGKQNPNIHCKVVLIHISEIFGSSEILKRRADRTIYPSTEVLRVESMDEVRPASVALPRFDGIFSYTSPFFLSRNSSVSSYRRNRTIIVIERLLGMESLSNDFYLWNVITDISAGQSSPDSAAAASRYSCTTTVGRQERSFAACLLS